MSEVRCRADHERYLADRDDDRVPVLGQFDVIGGHDIDRPDDGPPIANDNAHRLRCSRDFGESGPEGEFVAALLMPTRLASFDCPNRRIEDYLNHVVAPIDAGEVRAGVNDATGESVGSHLSPHALSAVNKFEDSPGKVQPPPSKQLGELFVLGSVFQPLPPSPVAKMRLHIAVRSLFHLLSRSRRRPQVRR